MSKGKQKQKSIDFTPVLPIGKNNAISAKQLQTRLHVRSAREVRECIAAARLTGQLICSGNTGYYRPATLAEVNEFVLRLETQAKSTLAVLKTAKRVLEAGNMDFLYSGNSQSEGQRANISTKAAEMKAHVHTGVKAAPPAGSMDTLRARLAGVKKDERNSGKT